MIPSDAVAASGQRRSVGRVLLVISAAVSVVILLLSFFLSFRLSSEEAILEDMSEVIQAVSNETVANTESFLAPAERSAEELTRLLEKGRIGDDGALDTDEFFFDVLRVNDSFDGIFVGDSNGSFTYVTRNDLGGYTTKDIFIDDSGDRIVRYVDHDATDQELETWFDPADEFDPRVRPWFSLAEGAENNGVWTSPYVFFSSGRPGVTRAQAVMGEEGGLTQVVGIDIRIDALSTFMSERRASPNGASFILDRQLSVVAYPDGDQVTQENQLAKATDLADPPVSFVSGRVENLEGQDFAELVSGSVGGDDYQFAITSLPNNPDWVVAVTAPDEDFLARVRDEQLTSRSIAAIGGLVSVILLAAGGLVVNNRYRREQEIADSALNTAVSRAEERDVARAQLSQTVEDLARSNADLEQYAYATAHDLRTPLRAIGGYAELLLREVGEDKETEDITDYAERIVEGYERMCLTMDNLLEHARATVKEPAGEAIELEPIAHEALSDFTETIDSLDADVSVSELGSAAVHPIAMRRVFQNLISNALNYRHPDRAPRINISGEQRGGQTVLHIADNGIGIDSDNHEAVFRLFNRLSNDDKGSGVGLALVRKLVEEHEGTIELTSATDVGSTFTIVLPAQPSQEQERTHSDV